MKAINLFNQWVDLGKDEGMETNHNASVTHMLSLLPDSTLRSGFRFLDIGCGNGWVVRRMSTHKNCISAVGLDGAKKMIKKATLHDDKSTYLEYDINNLKTYKSQFNIVFSMEVMYYLENPEEVIRYMFSDLLMPGGHLVIGLDHYLENTASLNWPNDLGVQMHTYSISQWRKIITQAGFKNVSISQFGKKKGWTGTLILYGQK